MRLKKAEHWCSGEDLEYGHDKHGDPHVRMVASSGASMWYPLFHAAKEWGEAREKAKTNWYWAIAGAQESDVDGERGPRERDIDGILVAPHEDEVPRRLQVSDDDEDEDIVPLNENGEPARRP